LLELFPVDEGGLDERQFTRIHKCVLGIIGSSLLDELNISTSNINDQDNTGRTPLFWACSRGDEISVRLLLQFGAKQISSGKIGAKDSPLHAASQAGHGEIARQLLLHGADANIKGEADMTPLFFAVAKHDGNSCVDVLLEYGADVNAEDNEQRTPLLVATQNGMLETSRKLLEHGAGIDHRAEDGWTPLACCIFWNMHDSILLLLEWDADYTIKTDDGDSVLHIAAQFADLDTLEVLRDAGLEGLNAGTLNESGKSAAEVAEGRVEEESWHAAFQSMMQNVREAPRRAERQSRPETLSTTKWDMKRPSELLERVVELSDTESEDIVFEDALENI
jgi:ankyrin repeat protein